MKRFLLLFLILSTCLVTSAALQAQTPSGYSVTCDNGASFDNGVEIVINQMRSGFNYTATAIGLNGFDPVLAVLDTNTGEGLCSDDTSDASVYAANLPTTGRVPASGLSSQVTFSQGSGNTFADISLVVGGFGNASGEFLLVLEGMAVTSGDGIGDVFSVNLTPGMVASGVPLTLYMLTRGDGQVDPYIYQVDAQGNALTDNAGSRVACDDAGNSSLCWGNSVNLSNSSVTIRTGTLPGWDYDAMVSLNISNYSLSSDMSQNYLNFAMSTSPSVTTQGQYLLVYHIGQTDAVNSSTQPNNTGNNGTNTNNGSTNSSTGGTESGNQSTNNQNTQTTNNSAGGMSVTCDNGASFDNGVEVILYDLLGSSTFTATAVGINGFDPVLAVLDANSLEGFCTDDAEAAAEVGANLPSSGEVAGSNLSAQITYTTPANGGDVSFVVGGFNNISGEFLLIIQGTSIDGADSNGDAISVNVTPAMAASGENFTVYMVTDAGSNLDPYIVQTDPQLNPITFNGSDYACDDAGGSSCPSGTVDLSDSEIVFADGSLPGWNLDAMLPVPLAGVSLSADRAQNYMTFVANKAASSTNTGAYVLVFHINAE